MAWSQTIIVSGTPPKERWGHTAAVAGSAVLMFGGFSGARCNDLHVMQTEIHTEKKKKKKKKKKKAPAGSIPPVSARPPSSKSAKSGKSAGKSPAGKSSGGKTKSTKKRRKKSAKISSEHKDPGEVQVAWAQLNPRGAIPAKRYGHTIANVSDNFYLFGGSKNTIERFDDVWLLRVQAQSSWSKLTPRGKAPSSRYAHSADVVDNKMYVFGGSHFRDHGLNDLHVLDPRETSRKGALSGDNEDMYDTWSKVETVGLPPSRRYYHASVVVGKKIYIFGGFDGDQHIRTNDVNVFHTASSTWSLLETLGVSPTPRHGHNLVYRESCQRLLVYGGFDGTAPWSEEVLELDLETSTWSAPEVTTSLSLSLEAIAAAEAAAVAPEDVEYSAEEAEAGASLPVEPTPAAAGIPAPLVPQTI